VDLTWANHETREGVEFQIERLSDGDADFVSIGESSTTTFTDKNVPENGFFYYRVRAVLANAQSEPSPLRLIRTQFVTVFDTQNALVNGLVNTAANCRVEKISSALLQGGLGTDKGMIARIHLKGPQNLALVVDRFYVSQVAFPNDPRNPANPNPDPWDSVPAVDGGGNKIEGGLTKVFDRSLGDSPATMLPPTPADPDANRAILNLVSYSLDPTLDLLIAFDVAASAATSNLVSGNVPGATNHALGGVAQAASDNRPPGFNTVANTIFVIEKIEVIKEQQP
jgi:hypothetical protein